MRGMIAAVSPEGIIGKDGGIPWKHPGDMRRFMRVTSGSIVIMGRATWESMDRKPLKNRRNIVITRQALADVEHYATIEDALSAVEGDARDVWFIGGSRIYEGAMKHVDVIDLTYVPDHVSPEGANYFPKIDETRFTPGPLVEHEDEAGLKRRVFTRAV